MLARHHSIFNITMNRIKLIVFSTKINSLTHKKECSKDLYLTKLRTYSEMISFGEHLKETGKIESPIAEVYGSGSLAYDRFYAGRRGGLYHLSADS